MMVAREVIAPALVMLPLLVIPSQAVATQRPRKLVEEAMVARVRANLVRTAPEAAAAAAAAAAVAATTTAGCARPIWPASLNE